MSIVNGVLDKALSAFVAYNNKQISLEELRTQLNKAMLRYGQPLPSPENGPQILFCDILLHQ